MSRLTFKKRERLTGKKKFELLFNTGKSFAVYPLRLVWMKIKKDGDNGKMEKWKNDIPVFQCMLGISVPKKSFAKAVDRNTIKRRIREAYRKNKHLLYDFFQKNEHPIALMIIYIAKEKSPEWEIEKKMIVSLQKLRSEI